MIRVRGLGCNHDRAATAMKTVANQSLPLEVHASGTLTLVEAVICFQFGVGVVWLGVSRLIRLRCSIIEHRRGTAESGQRTSVIHLNGVLTHVFPEALGSRNVFFTTDRLHRQPECLMVQPMTDFEKVMGMLEVVRPATNDRRDPRKPEQEAFLQRAIANRLADAIGLRLELVEI